MARGPSKARDAFRTISEVADWLDTPAHVLRFWESKFTQVKPVKRAGGRRYYRPDDMVLLGGIKVLLHDQGMTIKGVQRLLREEGVKHVGGFSRPLDSNDPNVEGKEATSNDTVDVPGKVVSNPAPPAPPPTKPSDDEANFAPATESDNSEPSMPDDADTELAAEEMPTFGITMNSSPPSQTSPVQVEPAPEPPNIAATEEQGTTRDDAEIDRPDLPDLPDDTSPQPARILGALTSGQINTDELAAAGALLARLEDVQARLRAN